MKTIINWRIFFTLLVSSLLSIAFVFPYVLTIQEVTFRQINIPLPIIFTAQLIQSAILFSVAIFFGLLLAKKVNFHVPILEAHFDHKDVKNIIKRDAGVATLSGALSAFAIYLADKIFTIGGSGISTSQNLAPIWQKLLASFYGGITEEILLRLFCMTFFVWIGMKLSRSKQPTQAGVYVAIILSSILFGLGHLPITAALTAITPLIIARAVVLNGIGGIIFGWLYWKKGLEFAMIAHFTADIFLLIIFPMI